MDISSVQMNAFVDNLGTDWVAIDRHGTPVCRATDRAAVERAVPDAVLYLTGKDFEKDLAKAVGAEKFDHDKDGHAGGSPKGEDSTAAKGAAKKADPPATPVPMTSPKAEAPKAPKPAPTPAKSAARSKK